MNLKKGILMAIMSAGIIMVIVLLPTRAKALTFGEADRYQPGTCTVVDEEGEVQVAICTKVKVDGPCVDEVKCPDSEIILL